MYVMLLQLTCANFQLWGLSGVGPTMGWNITLKIQFLCHASSTITPQVRDNPQNSLASFVLVGSQILLIFVYRLCQCQCKNWFQVFS